MIYSCQGFDSSFLLILNTECEVSCHQVAKKTIIYGMSTLMAQAAYAGAFSLYTESSTTALGTFAAGVAAEAGDASIGWYIR